MSEFVYRDATLEDAVAIAALGRETWTDTFGHLYPPEDLNGFLTARFGVGPQQREIGDPGFHYRLALKGGRLVGYGLMGPLDMPVDEPTATELHRLYVREDVKGAGVAARLMEDCIAWARARGATAIYLSVWENNIRAQRFYRRYGFADHGAWDFMVGRTADHDFIWRLAL